MRTTVDLPDELFRRAKVAAARRGITLKRLLAEALERALPDSADEGPSRRMAAIEAARRAARGTAAPGPDASRSQDFLYGEDGMPA